MQALAIPPPPPTRRFAERQRQHAAAAQPPQQQQGQGAAAGAEAAPRPAASGREELATLRKEQGAYERQEMQAEQEARTRAFVDSMWQSLE